MSRSKKRIRYGVVGLGNIAQVAVLPAFRHASEDSELVALFSSDDEKLNAFAKRYAVPHAVGYEEFDSLAASGAMDAVYLTLPNHLHREWTERAAAAGLHVLCEKPMALTEADCTAMIDVTRRHRVRLMVAYRLHFDEANLRAMELIREKALGEPRFFSSEFGHRVRPGDIRKLAETGGGALFDLGIYCINAARYLFRAEPIEVFGWTLPAPHGKAGEVDDTTCALLRFPNDCLAQFTVSQSTSSIASYRLVGTKGSLALASAYDYAAPMKLSITREDKTTHERFGKHDQFAAELVYFSRCILEHRVPEPSGEEGRIDVRVMEAIALASRRGHAIALPPSRRVRRPRTSQQIHKPPVAKPKTIHAPSPSLD